MCSQTPDIGILPAGWEVQVDQSQRIFFVNHDLQNATSSGAPSIAGSSLWLEDFRRTLPAWMGAASPGGAGYTSQITTITQPPSRIHGAGSQVGSCCADRTSEYDDQPATNRAQHPTARCKTSCRTHSPSIKIRRTISVPLEFLLPPISNDKLYAPIQFNHILFKHRSYISLSTPSLPHQLLLSRCLNISRIW